MLSENILMPKVPFWIFILIALLHFSAFRIDVMDIDASQYAGISMEMMKSGEYLQLYDHGKDYLDKPPFLFWVSAASMKIFGVNNFGYKLPSILFALLAIYATYRLSRLLYDEKTARMAALILGCCQGMFLMTNDIRTDTILTAWVITAIWCIREFEVNRKWVYMVIGSLAVACGMMTKGPIALMVPVFSFGTHWLLRREWKKIFDPRHLLYILLIAIFLIPMSIGLYQQFDLHPEKTVNGLKNVSGLRFFYWSQSFGRITGESPWNNGAKLDFLLVNMLWSFLPWIFVFIVALVLRITELFKQRFRLLPGQEWISTGGFLLSYLSLGLSKYQLPHYIFVAFPLAAIMVAKLLADLFEGKYTTLNKILKPVQYGVAVLLFVAIGLIITIIFPLGTAGIILLLAAFVFWLLLMLNKKLSFKMFWTGVIAILFANIIMSNHFYPTLLTYQVGSETGNYIRDNNISPADVAILDVNDPLNAIHFYANGIIDGSFEDIPQRKYVLTTDKGLQSLSDAGYQYTTLKTGSFFKVSELTPAFLNKDTRETATTPYYFVKLNHHE